MDLRPVRALLRLLDQHDLEELEIEEAGRRIRLRRRSPAPASAAAMAEPPPALPVLPSPLPAPAPSPRLAITAPMVGTFYRAPAPNAEPFVREGEVVRVGTVVCIIEAMKLMNEIEAEVGGRIVAVLVENGQPVEFGQPLFHLEPA
jgi:acetyl-CoA carboxylase biotin carboxyl carrier protein